jgi:hypothetical protein
MSTCEEMPINDQSTQKELLKALVLANLHCKVFYLVLLTYFVNSTVFKNILGCPSDRAP